MSTSLIAITNHKFSFDNLDETAKIIINEIEKLNLDLYCWINEKNEKIYDDRILSYRICDYRNDKNLYPPICIEFESPSSFSFTLYENCLEIFTIYRYSLIYENFVLDWFQGFRKDLFEIIQVFGGSEVIYLADNASSLSEYYEGMVIEGVSYEKVKSALIEQFGEPVTDYSKLDYDSLDYKNLKEFFLDDFKDLKNI